MAFDPKKHTIRVQGNREYLPVSARLVWFRAEHPDWGIVTSPVEINLEKQYAIFSATIFNSEGKIMATATKMENVRGFPDYIEKSETGSVGRALAMCGYGTQFAPEFEENGRFADSPQGGSNRFGSSGGGGGRSSSNYGGNNSPGFNRTPANNNSGGNGNGAPAMNRRPASSAPPPPMNDDTAADDVFADDDAPLAEAAPASSPPPARTAPAGRPATPGANITRVREPERDNVDPGGPDELDEDPFAEDEELLAAPPSRPTAPPARAAAARATKSASNGSEDSGNSGGDSVTSDRCSVDGCPAILTQGQITMSMNKFGRPLCPLHQREAAPVAGAGNSSNGGGSSSRRGGAPKPEPADTLL